MGFSRRVGCVGLQPEHTVPCDECVFVRVCACLHHTLQRGLALLALQHAPMKGLCRTQSACSQ